MKKKIGTKQHHTVLITFQRFEHITNKLSKDWRRISQKIMAL